MKIVFSIVLFISFSLKGRNVTATVSSGQVNAPNAQTTYSLAAGDTLNINNTATSYCNVGNITGTPSAHIVVRNIGGKINVTSSFTYLELTGTLQYVDFIFIDPADSAHGYGLSIRNSTYRSVVISGKYQNCTMGGLDVYAAGDYSFYGNHSRSYSGLHDNTNYHNTFSHIKVMKGNATPFLFGFSAGNYWDSLRFTDIVVDSFDVATIWALEWNFNIEVDHSRVTHTGLSDVSHAAVVYCRGSGLVHHNYIYDFWGDGTRWFGITLVGTKADPMGDCKFYNNVIINSRKYSACEINTQPGDTSSSWIRPVNYYMDNNTTGQLNAVDYYTGGGAGGGGAAFDIYYGFGLTKIRNNIYFNCYRDKGQGISGLNYLWHNGNSGATVDTSNNKYSTDGLSLLADTVTGAIKTTGLAVGTGLTIGYVATDNADVTRTVPYDIGAFKYTVSGSPAKTWIIWSGRKRK